MDSGSRPALPSPPRGVRWARQLSAGGGDPGIRFHVEPSSGASRVRGKVSASYARAAWRQEVMEAVDAPLPPPGSSSRSAPSNTPGLSGLPSTGWTGAAK